MCWGRKRQATSAQLLFSPAAPPRFGTNPMHNSRTVPLVRVSPHTVPWVKSDTNARSAPRSASRRVRAERTPVYFRTNSTPSICQSRSSQHPVRARNDGTSCEGPNDQPPKRGPAPAGFSVSLAELHLQDLQIRGTFLGVAQHSADCQAGHRNAVFEGGLCYILGYARGK